MTFQSRLRNLRRAKKLTQQEIADKLGITRQAYGYYENENSKREPDIETIQKLAEIFDVSTDYLLGRSDSKNLPELTPKDERDIAKRMEKLKQDLAADGGLSFYGEPLSEEAKESLLEAMEYAVRTAQRINKKYIPKKYREDN